MNKIKHIFAITLLVVVAVAIRNVVFTEVDAAPSVTITSPTSGQVLKSGAVTVSGTSTPNTTIQIFQGASQVGFTISDGSGNWSTSVDGLGDGSHTISARAVENGQYGYLGAAAGPGSYLVNRMRLSDNAFNPGGGGWPVASTSVPLAPALRGSHAITTDGKIYFVDYSQASSIPTIFDTAAPADPVATTSFQTNAGSRVAVISEDGTKAYSLNNNANNISIVTQSNNTQTATIPITSPQSLIWGISDTLFVSSTDGTSTGTVSIVDSNSNTITDSFSIPCLTANSVGSMALSNDHKYLYVACALDAVIRKVDLSNHSVISTIDLTSHGRTVIGPLQLLPNGKIYASGIYGVSEANKISVINPDDTYGGTITLTANAFVGMISPDGSRYYVSTQGPFDGSVLNIDVINTTTDSISDNIDTSSVGIGYVFTFDPPTYATATTSFVLGSASSSPSTSSQALAKTGEEFPKIVVGITGLTALAAALFIRIRFKKYFSPTK